MIRRLVGILALVLLAAPPANAALRAWVDHTQVAPGETVELTLEHDGQTNTQPDLAPLKQDFDIVGRSTSSSLQIINGATSATTQLNLTLAPKRTGRLSVPSISWDSDHSAPLSLDVSPSTGNATASGATANRVFIQTEVDPKSPYVQAATQVTVGVYTAVPLSQADLEFPASDTVLVHQVGSDETSTSERNGQTYQVVTRHFLVFPQRSGHLSIPGPTLSGNVPAGPRRTSPNDPFSQFFGGNPFGGMVNTLKPIRLVGQPIELDVRPRPPGAGASYWMPARSVKLTAQWQPQQQQAHVGDPLTITLRLQADGLTAAQLPDLSTLLALPDGIKAYPDEPKLKDTASGDELIGEREQSIALIADQPGNFTIPELRLDWWDTRTDQLRHADLPAQTLVVTPAPAARGNMAAPTPVQQATPLSTQAAVKAAEPAATTSNIVTNEAPWKWLTLGLVLLWLATVAAWLITHRRQRADKNTEPPGDQPRKPASTSTARSAFLAACEANDPQAARRNLLAWVNAARPGRRIIGLSALAKVSGDASLAALFRALDRACYTGESWQGATLATAMQRGSLPLPSAGVESSDKLAPLYH
jgi:BatD DUF11 like domain